MMVIAVNNAPPRLRGRLAVWLLEIRAGVYVGDYSARVRDRIWEQVCADIGEGDGLICWTAQTDQGFELRHRRHQPPDATRLRRTEAREVLASAG